MTSFSDSMIIMKGCYIAIRLNSKHFFQRWSVIISFTELCFFFGCIIRNVGVNLKCFLLYCVFSFSVCAKMLLFVFVVAFL